MLLPSEDSSAVQSNHRCHSQNAQAIRLMAA
jgi:hypothetical protein